MTTQKNSSTNSNSGTTVVPKAQPTHEQYVEEPLCNECEEKIAVVRKRSWLYCADCWLGKF